MVQIKHFANGTFIVFTTEDDDEAATERVLFRCVCDGSIEVYIERELSGLASGLANEFEWIRIHEPSHGFESGGF